MLRRWDRGYVVAEGVERLLCCPRARDPEERRVQSPSCVTCRFFHAGSSNGFGTCWHPDHQLRGVRITIRAQELNCYRGFGTHDWMPAVVGEARFAEDILISERPAPFRAPWRNLHPLDEPEAPSSAIRS